MEASMGFLKKLFGKSNGQSKAEDQTNMAECPKCGKSVPKDSLKGMAVISASSTQSTGKVCQACFEKSVDAALSL
jgi:ribosomal protein S26